METSKGSHIIVKLSVIIPNNKNQISWSNLKSFKTNRWSEEQGWMKKWMNKKTIADGLRQLILELKVLNKSNPYSLDKFHILANIYMQPWGHCAITNIYYAQTCSPLGVCWCRMVRVYQATWNQNPVLEFWSGLTIVKQLHTCWHQWQSNFYHQERDMVAIPPAHMIIKPGFLPVSSLLSTMCLLLPWTKNPKP